MADALVQLSNSNKVSLHLICAGTRDPPPEPVVPHHPPLIFHSTSHLFRLSSLPLLISPHLLHTTSSSPRLSHQGQDSSTRPGVLLSLFVVSSSSVAKLSPSAAWGGTTLFPADDPERWRPYLDAAPPSGPPSRHYISRLFKFAYYRKD